MNEHIEHCSQLRACSICGWRQTSGHAEDILCCPECGSCSWHTITVDAEGDAP